MIARTMQHYVCYVHTDTISRVIMMVRVWHANHLVNHVVTLQTV